MKYMVRLSRAGSGGLSHTWRESGWECRKGYGEAGNVAWSGWQCRKRHGQAGNVIHGMVGLAMTSEAWSGWQYRKKLGEARPVALSV